jgi:hypothetical protein
VDEFSDGFWMVIFHKAVKHGVNHHDRARCHLFLPSLLHYLLPPTSVCMPIELMKRVIPTAIIGSALTIIKPAGI